MFEKSEWIMAAGAGEDVCNRYFEYRTQFDADPELTTNLHISAHSQYVVYINGQFVNGGQYDDYEEYQAYDSLDITGYLKEKDNELYIGHYVCGENFSTRRKQIPGIIFEIRNEERLLLASDCRCLARVNRHFMENPEKITFQLGYTFEYDAKAEEAKYAPGVLAGKSKNLLPRPVKKTDILPFLAGKPIAQGLFAEKDRTLLKAQRMQRAFLSACERAVENAGSGDRMFREVKIFRPEGKLWTEDKVDEKEQIGSVGRLDEEEQIGSENNLEGIAWEITDNQSCDGVYVIFDLGGENTGLLEFVLDVEEEAEVLIGFGEHLDDMRVRTAVGGRNFCFRYLAKAGRNHFFYPYQRLGLRYLQFHVAAKKGSLAAGIRPQLYPLNKYTLPLADKLHQKIYEVGCRTLELCMHEHYEDCPWREQSQYAMDSRIQILCGYYAFREYDFPRETLRLMLRSMRPDGLLELCAPGRVPVNIPSFSAVFVREVLEYMEYSGDHGFAEEIFAELKKLVDGFVGRMRADGLIPLYCGREYWNFYEWRDGLDGAVYPKEEVVDCLLNAFVSDAFRCFGKICQMLGKKELAESYYAYHKRMNQAAHRMFFDKDAGAYRSNLTDEGPRHVLTQGMMLYVDAVPEEWVDRVAQAIITGSVMMGKIHADVDADAVVPFDNRNVMTQKTTTLIPCSISMSIYVYEALLKKPERYKDYVLGEIERIWSRMLTSGSDTFWETDLGADDFDNAGSLCHGWSAVPVYLFGKYYC